MEQLKDYLQQTVFSQENTIKSQLWRSKMRNISFMLMADTYKNTNPDALPKGLTKLTSYITPRKSMFKNLNEVVFFGLQGFIKEYMIEIANETFFKRPKEEVVAEYKKYLDNQIGSQSYDL